MMNVLLHCAHLWSNVVTFVFVVTFVVNYYVCGFYTLFALDVIVSTCGDHLILLSSTTPI